MEKKKNLYRPIFVLFVMIVLNSCHYVNDVLQYENADNEGVYTKLFKDSYSFANPDYVSHPDDGWTEATYFTSIVGHSGYEGKTITGYVDARSSDGYSTWSNPEIVFTYNSDISPDKPGGPHDHTYTERYEYNSPPVHLHLCLESLMEEGERWTDDSSDPSYYNNPKISRKWIMQSVEDEDGVSLADDENWSYYTDNEMIFEKASTFIYIPGIKRSVLEKKFFGTYEEHKELTGTYKVVEDDSKKVTLLLSFPLMPVLEFEVLDSNWNYLMLKGTIEGKTGILYLTPVSKTKSNS